MNRERITTILVGLGAAATALLWLAVFVAWGASAAARGECGTPTENASMPVAWGSLLAALPLTLVAYPLARAERRQPQRRIAGVALALAVLGIVGVVSAAFFTACWE